MRRGRTNAWMDGGYVELDDTWEGSEGTTVNNDVEMKEGVGAGSRKEGEKEQSGHGIRKWNSLRDHHHHHKDHQRGSKSTGLEGIQVRKSVDVTVQVEQSPMEHRNGRKRDGEYEKGTAL